MSGPRPRLWKFLQRRLLTYVSTTFGATIALVAAVVVVASLARAAVDLSRAVSRTAASRNWGDNIAGRAFDVEMCPEPVDVVYTWVNGSDPDLIASVAHFKDLLHPTESPSPSPSVQPANVTANGTLNDGSDGGEGEGETQDEKGTSNRFRDNNELRYSLRSIEKYAPWVRHIFIVTNGQVPHWLDTAHPRLTLVSHEDIFEDASHLPVFSSPAIEAHLHRIPGLSNKFVYFNDDVFLGSDTWPADFYSQADGQRVFLSWDVPKCSPGCIESWIGDGFCDQACNVSSCMWDATDCVNGTNVNSGGTTSTTYSTSTSTPTGYCATGCPGSWLGDLVCDNRCKEAACAWDAGDCGMDKVWHTLPGGTVTSNDSFVDIDLGAEAAYVNMTTLLDGLLPGNATVHSLNAASHSDCSGISSAIIGEPDRVLMLVLTTDWSDCPSATPHWLPAPPQPAAPTNPTPTNATAAAPSAEPASASSNATEASDPPTNVSVTIDLTDSAGATTTATFFLRFVKPSPSPAPSAPPAAPVKLPTYDDYGEDAPYFMGMDDDALGRRLLSVGGEGKLSERGANIRLTGLRMDAAVRLAWRQVVRVVGSAASDLRRHALRSGGRRLLDTYGDSLVNTNRMLNTVFDRHPRKVPAHMPHMIDVKAMSSLQAKFPDAFAATSSHKFRDPHDVQFAFAYFYWVMEGGAQEGLKVEQYWRRELDTNNDGALDDNELRTLAAVITGGHPSHQQIHDLRVCLAPPTVKETTKDSRDGPVVVTETLTPRITIDRLMACELATSGLSAHARFPKTHTEATLDEVAFEMVTDDFNKTLDQLDSVRARKTKFVCINDDMKEAPPAVVAALHDFYESYFPFPSQFELPPGRPNAFLHIGPLKEYQLQHRLLRISFITFLFITCGWITSRIVRSRVGAGASLPPPASPNRGARARRRRDVHSP